MTIRAQERAGGDAASRDRPASGAEDTPERAGLAVTGVNGEAVSCGRHGMSGCRDGHCRTKVVSALRIVRRLPSPESGSHTVEVGSRIDQVAGSVEHVLADVAHRPGAVADEPIEAATDRTVRRSVPVVMYQIMRQSSKGILYVVSLDISPERMGPLIRSICN